MLAKVRSVDRRLDRLESWLRELFETMETVRLTVTANAPDALIWQGESPPNDTYVPPPYSLVETISLPRFQALFEILRQADEFNDYRNRQIRNLEQYAIAAVPEHWQVRSPQVPQACFLLADLDESANNGLGRSRWSLNVPHYRYGPEYDPSLQFQKGSHFGSLRLLDGSQVIVNCLDESECDRVLNLITDWIDPDFLSSSPEILFSQRRGQNLSTKTVKAIRVTFHQNGQSSTIPEWVKYL